MKDLIAEVNKVLNINLGRNKSHELARLIYEIHRFEGIPIDIILTDMKEEMRVDRINKGKLFLYSKQYLLRRRFPEITSRREKFKPYLNKFDITDKSFRINHPYELIPENVFVVKEIEDNNFIQKILKSLPSNVNIEFISSLKEYRKRINFSSDRLRKRDLFITEEKFDFYKPCPCTKQHIGCGYFIMNLVFGCPMDCTYCYLQQYSNYPGIIINVNLEDYFSKFNNLYKVRNNMLFRMGTGEFSDSLAFDEWTHFSKRLVNFFRDKNVLFELKTKTDNVAQLKGLDHNKKTIVSWSLNPSTIIEKEELYTAGLHQRLKAAKECQSWGYPVGFHFDPIFYYDNWQKDYKKVIEELFNYVNSPIAWISLGTFRFNPQLKGIIEKRFPRSDIIYSELILGEDRKLRYPKFIRKRIYNKMIKWIREYDKQTGIYLCMESADVWKDTIMRVDSDVENFVVYQAGRNVFVTF